MKLWVSNIGLFKCLVRISFHNRVFNTSDDKHMVLFGKWQGSAMLFIDKLRRATGSTNCFMWRVRSLSIGYCFVSHVIPMSIDDFRSGIHFFTASIASRPTDRQLWWAWYNHTRYTYFGLRLMKSAWMLVSFGHRHSFNGFNGGLDIHFCTIMGQSCQQGEYVVLKMVSQDQNFMYFSWRFRSSQDNEGRQGT